jgi:AcrR family transcriptional regulator
VKRAELDMDGLVEAFAADGIHGVGMVEIARASGVAKPTLYRVHPSKDALFLACVEAEVERLLERLYGAWAEATGGPAAAAPAASRGAAGAAPAASRVAAGVARSPLAAAIAALARALLAHADERPAAFRLLFATADHRGSAVADDVAGALDRIVDRLAELLARHPDWHADPADAELVAGLLPAAAVTAVRRGEEPWNRDAVAARIGALLDPPPFAA